MPSRHFRPEQDILQLNHEDWSVIRSLAFLSFASRLSFRYLNILQQDQEDQEDMKMVKKTNEMIWHVVILRVMSF
ncbi:hypothetical protein E4U43_000694 [Claviceps pusilla]|uniref:Uncharacterized protein n=1 Tax=Claviceps pusilla TaxID=123648 RepID=A0A9P7SYV9_9HYPO|nr:hypothetical protein E4U43_000694 [Claviceps pusilla]